MSRPETSFSTWFYHCKISLQDKLSNLSNISEVVNNIIKDHFSLYPTNEAYRLMTSASTPKEKIVIVEYVSQLIIRPLSSQ